MVLERLKGNLLYLKEVICDLFSRGPKTRLIIDLNDYFSASLNRDIIDTELASLVAGILLHAEEHGELEVALVNDPIEIDHFIMKMITEEIINGCPAFFEYLCWRNSRGRKNGN